MSDRPCQAPGKATPEVRAIDDKPAAPSTPQGGRTVMEDGRPPLVVTDRDGSRSEQEALEHLLALTDEDRLIAALWHLGHDRLVLQALRRQLPLDVAEDIVQDVFALLTEQLQRVRGPKILGWLATMVDYECRRHLTRLYRGRSNQSAVVRRQDQSSSRQATADPEERLDRRRAAGQAWTLVSELEPLDAYIMRASIVDEADSALMIEVIARRFEVQLTRGALYARRRRIRRLLAHRMTTGRRGGVHRGEHD